MASSASAEPTKEPPAPAGAPGAGGVGADAGAACASSVAADYLRSGGAVVDAHLHLVSASEVGYPKGVQDWFNGCGVKTGRSADDPTVGDFLEPQYAAAVAGAEPQGAAASGVRVNVSEAVFIEVLPEGRGAVREAAWVLHGMVPSPASRVAAFVGHLPVTGGAEAVRAFLAELLEELRERGDAWALAQTNEAASVSDSEHGDAATSTAAPRVHPALRGARNVFNGIGEVHDAAIQHPLFLEGLVELGRLGLHFEFCVRAERLPLAVEVARRCPGTRFVLDHCGLNQTGQQLAAWKRDVAALAALPNVVACKISALEEWDPVDGDPGPYIDHVLATFGPARCMYGANWFVPLDVYTPPHAYSEVAELVAAALDRAGSSPTDVAQVFAGTARSVYGLPVAGRDDGGDGGVAAKATASAPAKTTATSGR